MLSPCLSSGVEKRYHLPRLGVTGRGLQSLVPIAKRTAQPEIRFVIGAPLGDRNEVLDFQACHDQMLRTETIPTTVARRRAHAPFDLNGDIASCHVNPVGVSNPARRQFSR